MKRIIFHDPNFIEKRYEETGSKIKNGYKANNLRKISTNKNINILKKPIHKEFNMFENEFLGIMNLN